MTLPTKLMSVHPLVKILGAIIFLALSTAEAGCGGRSAPKDAGADAPANVQSVFASHPSTGMQLSPQGGTITGPTTGGGLVGSNGTLGLLMSCGSGQTEIWDGVSAWGCGSAGAGGGSGTVTSVGSGSGIFGGPITGTGNLSIDPVYTQRRVSSTCTSPNAVAVVNQDGTVTCTTNVVDTAGTSLWKSGSTLNVGLPPVSCGAGSAITAIGSNGTGTCTAVGGGSSGSLSVTVNAFPVSTTNLSTVGTLDWFWWGNGGDPGAIPGWTTSTATTYHWKKGGSLWRDFIWIGHGIGSAPNAFPSSITFTSTAADDSYGVALSATDGTYDLTGTTGLGYQFNIAAGTTSQTLRIYCGAKGVITTITASLDDASASPASATFNNASGVHTFQAVDVVFNAAGGTRLRVTVLATTLNGGVQDEDFYGAAEF